ncbi:FecR domain-containing protein [Chitinophaga sp.]|uniref:FecR family protein n=1 Tax=Chitinophaga sp. TaxID=1869181 RepID=UPI0031DD1049
MDRNRLDLLIQKYIDRTATPAEQDELNNWYREFTGEADPYPMTDVQEAAAGQAMHAYLTAHIHRKKRPSLALYASLAAACLLGVILYLNWPKAAKNKNLVAVIPAAASENRFIYLPDSSKVLLHPGSKMDYRYNGNNREVTLEGEAYFDVASQPAQPFIIHTGRVSTTVLGTSLNIKAWNTDSVTVSVLSGKVQVTDAYQQKTILTPNEQVVYNQHTNNIQQVKIIPATVIAWAKSDMQFQDMPYEQLAQKLDRRYDVNIVFKNPALQHCPITGRFSGTESLNEVLDILSQTMGTTYSINGRTVELDGTACFNQIN